jgi:hypothetical protein
MEPLAGLSVQLATSFLGPGHVEFNRFKRKMQALQNEVQTMKEARHKYEEDLDRRRREAQRALVAAFVRHRSAKVIQRFWGQYWLAKKKAAKEAKGKGNGKGGKK